MGVHNRHFLSPYRSVWTAVLGGKMGGYRGGKLGERSCRVVRQNEIFKKFKECRNIPEWPYNHLVDRTGTRDISPAGVSSHFF